MARFAHILRSFQTRRANPKIERLEDRSLPSASWMSFAHDPQHTGLTGVASQDLDAKRWQMPVDLSNQGSTVSVLVHYGSPLLTAANTLIAPVTTGYSSSGPSFRVEAHDAAY